MKRVYVFLVTMLLMLFGTNVNAEEINQENFPDSGETKMLYGEKHVFSVVVPANWITDAEAEKQTGIPFLTRPDVTEDWNNVYMYALGFDQPENSKETIMTFMDSDIKNFKANHPGITIKKLNTKFASIKKSETLSGKYYIIEFSNFGNTYKEIVVYIEFPQGVGTIVFSTNSKEVYEKYYSDFLGLVNSFQFIANNITVIDLNE